LVAFLFFILGWNISVDFKKTEAFVFPFIWTIYPSVVVFLNFGIKMNFVKKSK
jgi:hypothetical protein